MLPADAYHLSPPGHAHGSAFAACAHTTHGHDTPVCSTPKPCAAAAVGAVIITTTAQYAMIQSLSKLVWQPDEL